MKQLINISLLFIVMIIFAGCRKKFLEVIPLGNQVATTVEDFDKIMNEPDYYYTQEAGLNEAVIMGDELAAEGPYFNNVTEYNTRLFQWRDSIYIMTDQSPFFITRNLDKMYTLNLVIQQVMDATDGTDVQKKRILAEAKATRAFLNFIFVNYYAKPYDASTASTDPGFPIIEQPDITVKYYDRGTVQSSYDFIIKDFTEALPDLPARPSIVTRMSQPGVEALLGKVYLFMGKYAEALTHIENTFDHIAANGAPVLYNYNTEFEPGGSFHPIDPTFGPSGPWSDRNDMTEAVLSKVFYNGVFQGNMFGVDGLVLKPETQALFTPNDQRLKLYTNANADGTQNTSGRLRKYNQYSRFGIELPDLYLMRAECKARLNDLGGAKADIETLRFNRIAADEYEVPSNIAGDQVALIKFIIDERLREFAREGYRWFDMRRLSVDPIFAGSTFKHIIYNSDGSTEVYTLQQPKRLVLQIPPRIALSDPEFQNNP